MSDVSANDANHDTGVIRLEAAEAFCAHSQAMLKTVVRSVYILAPSLDASWLGHDDFVESLKLAIIKNRRVQVKLLTSDPTEAVKTNHPLLPLIRKLSRFEAKVIPAELLEKQPLKQAALLVDRKQIVLRQFLENYLGFAHYDDTHTVKRQIESFEQYWRYAVEHADLRHVYL